MHPGEHLVRLAYLDDLVPFGQGVGLILEGWPGNWIYHLVDGHWTLVLDLCHVVDFNRLIPRWGTVAGVRVCVIRLAGGLRCRL